LTKKASGTAIGYGTRSDFTNCLTVSPSSSKYNLKTFWDENKNKKKGAVFALSRDVNLYLFRKLHSIAIFQHNKWLYRHQLNIMETKSQELVPQNTL
jgi:hypothetical protein